MRTSLILYKKIYSQFAWSGVLSISGENARLCNGDWWPRLLGFSYSLPTFSKEEASRELPKASPEMLSLVENLTLLTKGPLGASIPPVWAVLWIWRWSIISRTTINPPSPAYFHTAGSSRRSGSSGAEPVQSRYLYRKIVRIQHFNLLKSNTWEHLRLTGSTTKFPSCRQKFLCLANLHGLFQVFTKGAEVSVAEKNIYLVICHHPCKKSSCRRASRDIWCPGQFFLGHYMTKVTAIFYDMRPQLLATAWRALGRCVQCFPPSAPKISIFSR